MSPDLSPAPYWSLITVGLQEPLVTDDCGFFVRELPSNATPTENSYEKDLRADVCLSSGNHDGSNRWKKRVVGQRFEEKKTSSFITEPRELLVKSGDHAPTSEVASNHAR
jgi:hypothetical protein